MLIHFTKLSAERHALEVVRDDGRRERVELETRSCLLHDLTHLAVEEAAGLDEGFWGSLARGKTFSELNGKDGEGAPAYTGAMLQIERTVAVLQHMPKSGAEPAAAHARIVQMLAYQGETPPPWFTLAFVTEVHRLLRRLVGEWKATPYGQSMRVSWPGTREAPAPFND